MPATIWTSHAPWPAALLSRPAWPVPPGACDAHMHVFDPGGAHTACADARYSLPPAGPAAYDQTAAALGLTRRVLVQPSYYGSDNRFLLRAMAASAAEARGVVIVADETSAEALAPWTALGVRGLRLDLFRMRAEGLGPSAIASRLAAAGRLAQVLGWSLDLYVPGRLLLEHLDAIAALTVPVSVAHLGYLTHAEVISDAQCDAALRRIADSPLWIKLTGSYRYGDGPGAERADRLARQLVATIPRRLLWGSDWPHVMSPPQDGGLLLGHLAVWCPDDAARHAILVDNPARLYGFDG